MTNFYAQRRTNSEISELLRQQQASGLSVAAFCRRETIKPASFYAWRRRHRETVAHGFVEIQVNDGGSEAPVSAPAITVAAPDGSHIHAHDHAIARELVGRLICSVREA